MNDAATKRYALLAATLSSFLTPFMGSSVNIALPAMGRELSLDPVLLGWVATSYLLAVATCLLPFGRLADIYGRRTVFSYGIILYTASSLLVAMAPSAHLLIAFRTAQGIGGAMILGTGVAILTAVFPPRERGKALGINAAAVYLGLTLGPVLGGVLTHHLGWRSIFLANVPLGLIAIGIVLWKLKGDYGGARGEGFDPLGAALLGLSLVAVTYGFAALHTTSTAWLVAVGILGLGGFVHWERRAPHPLVNLDLFRNSRTFTFSNLAALITYSATYAVSFVLSLYLQFTKGLSAQGAGLVLVCQPAVMATLSPVAGRLSDHVEPRIIASCGLALIAAGLAWLAFLREDSPLTWVVVGLAAIGLGFALFSSPNTNAVMSAVERKHYGIAAATVGTMRVTGQTLSLGVAMLLLGIKMGRTQMTSEHYHAFLSSARTAFAVLASLCLLAIAASLARGSIHQGNT